MRRFMYYDWLMSGSGIGISGILSFMFVRLILAVVVILVLALVFKNRSKIIHTQVDDSFLKHSDDLLSLLNERLVKGEITLEEYQKLKKEIGEQK